jgi:zinc protease
VLLTTVSYAGLDVKREVLNNGLTLLVTERHNLPLVMVTMGIRAGALLEPPDRSGLANLVAELLTEGTETRTGKQISEEIEFVGGSLGASAGDDYITVSLSVLKKDISLGFELLSDIVLNPVFPEQEMKKKVERTKAGLKSAEENPGFVASRVFIREVFGDHPYGRLVQGSEETLDRITRGDLVDFYANNYVPNSSVLSVVGDITPKEVKDLLGKYFSRWARLERASEAAVGAEVIRTRKTITIDRDLSQANIILGHAGVSRDDPDYYAVSVMNYILGGGGFASRLMQNIREERGLAYDVSSSVDALMEGGSFRVSVQTKNESANTVIQEILNEMRKMRSSPVSDTELSDAKAFLTGIFPVRIETSRRIANFLVAVEFYGLGLSYIDNYPLYINSVSREDILEAARRHLDPENYILVIVADIEEASLRD